MKWLVECPVCGWETTIRNPAPFYCQQCEADDESEELVVMQIIEVEDDDDEGDDT